MLSGNGLCVDLLLLTRFHTPVPETGSGTACLIASFAIYITKLFTTIYLFNQELLRALAFVTNNF